MVKFLVRKKGDEQVSKDLTFTDPPTAYRREKVYDWEKIYAELRGWPGKWALLDEQGKVSIHNAIKGGKISNFHPNLGVESMTANTDTTSKPRRADIYVRYNPDNDTSITAKEREKMWILGRKKDKEMKD
jgi:hypothetical protein